MTRFKARANLQALHGARERELVGRLDDEVDVVPLHGEVNEAEAKPGAAALEGAPQLTKAAMRAEVPDFLPHSRGDVQRAAGETGTRAMNDVSSRALALPPRTLSCTAPERKRKLLLPCDHVRSVRGGSDMTVSAQEGWRSDVQSTSASPARLSAMPGSHRSRRFDARDVGLLGAENAGGT